MVHQPQRRLRKQRAVAPLVRQQLHRVCRGLGRGVFGKVQHLVARGRPPRLFAVLLRARFERRRHLRRAPVLRLLQRQPQQRQPVRRKLSRASRRPRPAPPGPSVPPPPARTPCRRADRPPVSGPAAKSFFSQSTPFSPPRPSPARPPPCACASPATTYAVMNGCAVVGLPPAPPAVFVLEVVQPVQPRADLLLQPRPRPACAFNPSSCAACVTMTFGRKLDIVCSTQPYGKRGQVLQRPEQRSCDRRRKPHRQAPRSRLHFGRERQVERRRRCPPPPRRRAPAPSSRPARSPAVPVPARPTPHRSAPCPSPSHCAPAFARTRQSTLASPRLGTVTSRVRAFEHLQPLHLQRNARGLRVLPGSCAPAR